MRLPQNDSSKPSKQIESLRDALLGVMDDDQRRRWSPDFQNIVVQDIEDAVERVRNPFFSILERCAYSGIFTAMNSGAGITL